LGTSSTGSLSPLPFGVSTSPPNRLVSVAALSQRSFSGVLFSLSQSFPSFLPWFLHPNKVFKIVFGPLPTCRLFAHIPFTFPPSPRHSIKVVLTPPAPFLSGLFGRFCGSISLPHLSSFCPFPTDPVDLGRLRFPCLTNSKFWSVRQFSPLAYVFLNPPTTSADLAPAFDMLFHQFARLPFPALLRTILFSRSSFPQRYEPRLPSDFNLHLPLAFSFNGPLSKNSTPPLVLSGFPDLPIKRLPISPPPPRPSKHNAPPPTTPPSSTAANSQLS